MSVGKRGQAVCSNREGSHGINRTLIKRPGVLNKAPLCCRYHVTRYHILSRIRRCFSFLRKTSSYSIKMIRIGMSPHLKIESDLERRGKKTRNVWTRVRYIIKRRAIVLIRSNVWIYRQTDILVTDRAKIAQGRNCVPQSVNKSLIYMRARVSWLDIDERPCWTRIYQSLVLPTKDLPANDMVDDNSRGRGLKSSLKNECRRDMCVRVCTYMHMRGTIHAGNLARENGVMVVVVPNTTVAAKLQHSPPPPFYLHANDRGYRKTITRHRIKYSTMPPQAVICSWRQQPLQAATPKLINCYTCPSSACYFSGQRNTPVLKPQSRSIIQRSLLRYSFWSGATPSYIPIWMIRLYLILKCLRDCTIGIWNFLRTKI